MKTWKKWQANKLLFKIKRDIFINKQGFIKEIKTRELGLLLIELGGGRKQITDQINYNVGYDNVLGVGDQVDASTPILNLYSNSIQDCNEIKEKIKECFIIADSEVSKPKEIYKVIN